MKIDKVVGLLVKYLQPTNLLQAFKQEPELERLYGCIDRRQAAPVVAELYSVTAFVAFGKEELQIRVKEGLVARLDGAVLLGHVVVTDLFEKQGPVYGAEIEFEALERSGGIGVCPERA